MKKIVAVMLTLSALTACQSNDAAQASASSTETNATNNAALISAALSTAMSVYSAQGGVSETPVVSTIEDQLAISPEQAVGGVGALLSVAQNSLGASEKSELAGLIPGGDALNSSGLVPLITNMDTVKTAFSGLGLDPALVSQFSPIIIQVLQTQGASSTLLSGLSSVWN